MIFTQKEIASYVCVLVVCMLVKRIKAMEGSHHRYASLSSSESSYSKLVSKSSSIFRKQTKNPLIKAVKKDDWTMFQDLLSDPHIDVNEQDLHGNTALMYAVIGGKSNMVMALITDHRLQIMIRNRDERMAQEFAQDNKEIHRMLFTRAMLDGKVETETLLAVMSGIRDPKDITEIIFKEYNAECDNQGVPVPEHARPSRDMYQEVVYNMVALKLQKEFPKAECNFIKSEGGESKS